MSDFTRSVDDSIPSPMLNSQYWEWKAKGFEDEITRLKAEVERLNSLLEKYRYSVVVNTKMSGPEFQGCNYSSLKRAWEADKEPKT
tara:strand:- start:9669 stop:9926 length:258 start_codon:yes stop_codon:yes gene_type:complete